jgi:hypothetical protein
VLALIDDPARWPAGGKAERACKALRKALIAAHDAIAVDTPVPGVRRPRKTSSAAAAET